VPYTSQRISKQVGFFNRPIGTIFTKLGQIITDNNFFYSAIGEKVAIKAM
jgi:hypothetical protein